MTDSRARFDLVVRGGELAAGAARVTADLGVRDGRICAIAERLEDATHIIEAAGRLVLPGGVDAHCHMDQPQYGGTACADDFRSGTLAAACGGTTTIIPFAMAAASSDPLIETVASYRRKAERNALIDYAIHPTVQSVTPETLDSLIVLIRGGYASIKIFTTYDGFRLDDRAIVDVMRVAAKEGALVMVHAENDGLIAAQTRSLIARGMHALRYHSEARPALAEQEAIHRVATFAEVMRAKILIVHVSSQDGLREIARAKKRGIQIYAETCPHYLLLTDAELDRDGPEAAKYVCSPPLRKHSDQTALWAAMAQNAIDIYSSDHSPCRLAGPHGKLQHGPQSRFDQIASGLPGLSLRLPLLFSEGFLQGRISLAQFVSLTSGNAAELHCISPQKGGIALGADADLVLWDMERETTISHELLYDQVDYTPYEGMRIRGWPVTTIARGEVVVDNGRMLGKYGRGRFVPCVARKNR
jgi:dihydropyrimidinase